MPTLKHLRAAVLDTHVWLWASAGDTRAAKMSGFHGQCIIAAISLWEIAMLASKGRVLLRPTVDDWIKTNLETPVTLEPLSAAIAMESCRLPDFHGDPADRLIVATALVVGTPLITADEKIHRWNQKHRALQVYEP